MRFCPFCSAENNDDTASCVSCGRRLPPLPPRRARNAPPTGVQLPARPPAAARKSGTTVPPPIPSSGPQPSASASQSLPPIAPLPPALPLPPPPAAGVDDMVTNPSVTALPPQHAFSADDFNTMPSAPAFSAGPAATPAANDDGKRSLLSVLSPGPAAQRREAPPPEPRDPNFARRANERPPTPPPPIPGSGPRLKPPSLPPPGPNAELRPLTPPPISTDESQRRSVPELTPDKPAVQYPVLPKDASGDPVFVAAGKQRPTGDEPPPTRVGRDQAMVDRPFTPPRVLPVPEIPEPGFVNAAKYSVKFTRARWQRRGAIKTLGGEIKQDTEALDQVLGALGKEARAAKVEGRVFSAENAAIDAAEQRMKSLGQEHGEVDARKADENSKFVDIERERNAKLAEAEKAVEEASHELQHLEAQRRTARDKRKEIERRQKTYLKNAEDNDRQAGNTSLGDARQDLRRSAEGHRKEAAALEPERQEVDRKLASLERPIGEATARLDAAKAELDAAKRSLTDAREGHTHRLAELEAEQKRKSREIGLAEAEVQRRLVTLGTLVNLNRIENASFAELYERIDRIRGAITARTTEIEKLTAERDAYDKPSLIRGFVVMGGAFVLLITFIVILRAMLK